MNILLRNKLRQIHKTQWRFSQIKHIKLFPFIALGCFGLYAFRKRIKEYIHKKSTINITKRLTYHVHNIFSSDEIRRDGVNLLKGVFEHPSTKNAVGHLIKGALKDKEILQSIKHFTSSLFIDLIHDKSVKDQLVRNTILLMQNKQLRTESIELFKDLLNQSKTKELFIDFCKEVALRDDIKQMFTSLIVDSTINTMRLTETKKKASEFIADIWSDSSLRWNVFKKTFMFWQNSSNGNNVNH